MHRGPAISRTAEIFGITPAVAASYCQAGYRVDGGSTFMGKGSRAHVGPAWCAAMSVLSCLDELKSSTERLQAFVDCKLRRSETRIVRQSVMRPNSLAATNWDHRKADTDYLFDDQHGNESPFLELGETIAVLASDKRNGGAFRAVYKLGYRIDIHTSPEFYVEISRISKSASINAPGDQEFIRRRYFPSEEDAKRLNPKGLLPSPKCFSLVYGQIEAMSDILADSWGAAAQGADVSHSLSSSYVAAPRANPIENENAGTSPKVSASSTDQSDASPKAADSSNNQPSVRKSDTVASADPTGRNAHGEASPCVETDHGSSTEPDLFTHSGSSACLTLT